MFSAIVYSKVLNIIFAYPLKRPIAVNNGKETNTDTTAFEHNLDILIIL